MSKDYENADNFVINGGKKPCCLFNFEPECVWNAQTGADNAGGKKKVSQHKIHQGYIPGLLD